VKPFEGFAVGSGIAVSRRISESTVRRLSHYLRALDGLEQVSTQTVSSDELAVRGGTTAAQVRKDLSQFGSFGKRGLGYSVSDLGAHLRGILGLDVPWRVVLVGAGRIGSALFEYPTFAARGFDCVAVLDSDPAKIGQCWGQTPILSAHDLEWVVRDRQAEIAILSVPADAAQDVADSAVRGGAKGLLNFAPVRLRVPPGIAVTNVNLVLEMEGLSFAITQARSNA
jgi:redox-sensing transcriptional repressor